MSGPCTSSMRAGAKASVATIPSTALLKQIKWVSPRVLLARVGLACTTFGVTYKRSAMVDIEVYSKPKQKTRQPAEEWLPSTPFLMGVSGPSMAGKGVLIQN